jgi:hypothetical protein
VDAALVAENITYGFEKGDGAKPSRPEAEHSGIEKQVMGFIELVCTSCEDKEGRALQPT